jgi:hypothetical protein
VCSCDEWGYLPCPRCKGTRHDPAYFDPQNEVARPEEPPAESLARVVFCCDIDESAGLAELA